MTSKCEIDCRLCTTLVEVCGRKGDTDRALEAYAQVSACCVCNVVPAGVGCVLPCVSGC